MPVTPGLWRHRQEEYAVEARLPLQINIWPQKQKEVKRETYGIVRGVKLMFVNFANSVLFHVY